MWLLCLLRPIHILPISLICAYFNAYLTITYFIYNYINLNFIAYSAIYTQICLYNKLRGQGISHTPLMKRKKGEKNDYTAVTVMKGFSLRYSSSLCAKVR